MLKTLAFAALALLVGSAAWAGPGADFCTVMQQNYLACDHEALKNSHGCPETIASFESVSATASASSTAALRDEIDRARDKWVEDAKHVIPYSNEDKTRYRERRYEARTFVVSECQKLRALD